MSFAFALAPVQHENDYGEKSNQDVIEMWTLSFNLRDITGVLRVI